LSSRVIGHRARAGVTTPFARGTKNGNAGSSLASLARSQ
jgi:hypothetical protein